ncbi:MAG: 2Fe-2S iron-sulfur cluster binding domain-containing protein [Lentisphaerae bacterium]|nr:2Fe-2S iron-sulfur cluster binding domain-containing protein [Lentisphaerota bacterium]
MLATAAGILAVSGIAGGLAALLVLAERIIRNYGECEILINGERTLTAQGGQSLLETLSQQKIFIPSACGGRGTCAYCKLKVLDGGGPLLPTEEPYLDAAERAAGVRLSCQVKVRGPLRIEIPEHLFRVREFAATCASIRDLTHDIKEFRFALRDPARIEYTPGQYLQLFTPSYDGNEEVYRAYSMSSDPADREHVELVIRLVPGGICTTWCFEHLQEGDHVTFNGPYGDFRLSKTEAPMIFVAGGSGMAPIKCILHQMQNEGIAREATYFFGANRADELFYLDEMAAFEKALPGFRFVPVVAHPEAGGAWQGETGLVTDAARRNLPDLAGHEGYLCGSPGLIQAAVRVLTDLGMPEDKIYYDTFG